MKLLIKNIRIVDPNHDIESVVDIYIEEGIILSIGNNISTKPKTEIFDLTGSYVSIGWMDIGTQIGEPGYEQRETLESVSNAAWHGGYTALACFPNTDPPIHTKSQVNFVLSKTVAMPVDFYPIASVSRAGYDNELTDFMDLRKAGATAFSNGSKSIQGNELLLRALDYAKASESIIINGLNDSDISRSGVMHEGRVSTSLGLEGIPCIAEDISLNQQLELAAHSRSRYIAHNISTKKAVKLVSEAKKNNPSIEATVSYLNLVATEDMLSTFDAAYKILPPLRESTDKKALIDGVKKGTIKAITSNHQPKEPEIKDLEFSRAAFGAIGLQTTFPVLNTELGSTIDKANLIACLSGGPREMLGLPVPKIAVGEKANLTLFNPELDFKLTPITNQSKSRNSPFMDKSLKGKITAVVNGSQWFVF